MNPFVIPLISQKGGGGKTTTAINLCVASELAGHTSLLIDLDPQGSAYGWYLQRVANARRAQGLSADFRPSGVSPVVVSAQAKALSDVIAHAAHANVESIVIDTAASSSDTTLKVLEVADLVIIPCQAAAVDVAANKTSIEWARFKNKEPFVLLTMLKSRVIDNELYEKILTETYGVGIMVPRTSDLMDYPRAMAAGQGVQEYNPNGKAAEETAALYKWACVYHDTSTRRPVHKRRQA